MFAISLVWIWFSILGGRNLMMSVVGNQLVTLRPGGFDFRARTKREKAEFLPQIADKHCHLHAHTLGRVHTPSHAHTHLYIFAVCLTLTGEGSCPLTESLGLPCKKQTPH